MSGVWVLGTWIVGTLYTLCMEIRVFFVQKTESLVLNIQFKTIGFLSIEENNRVLSDLDIFFGAVWEQMVREAVASFQ